MKKLKNFRKNYQLSKGITLIALVVTIIVLLILAGIAINLTVGDNGLFTRAKQAVDIFDISKYEELIKLAEGEARLEKIENEEINVLDRVKEILQADKNFKEAIMKKIQYEDKETLIIFIKNHAFILNDDGVKYLGTSEDFNVPSAKGNITVTKTPTEWAKRVIITAKSTQDSYEIEYSIGNRENWKKYKETGIEVTENTSVYIRLNIANVYGEDIEIVVDNIDTIDPSAIISGIEESAYINQPKTVGVDLIDNESGIDLEKSKWVYSNTGEPIGIEDLTKYTKDFKDISDNVTLVADSEGTWYLHVLVVDKAQNMIEKISETGITVTTLPTTAATAKDFNYNGGIQTYTVPVTGVYKLEVYGAQGGTPHYRSTSAVGRIWRIF